MGIEAVSNSMLGLWFRCGIAFQYRYLEGMVIPPGIAARRGSALHKACDINHKQKIDTQEDLPLDSLQDAARDEYINLVKEEGVYIAPEDRTGKDRLLNEGLNEAISATAIYRDQIAPQIIPIETEIYYRDDVGLDLPVCGIIDVIDESNVEHDFKTSNRKKADSFFRTSTQPTFYLMLRNRIYGAHSFFRYHIITTGGVLQEVDVTRGNDDFKRLLIYIQMFIDSLKAGVFKPAEPGHWLCSEKWCGYSQICKYRQF